MRYKPYSRRCSPRWLNVLAGLLLILCLAPVTSEADTVYQFYDEEGTLIVTNRPGDLPSGSSAKILVSHHRNPTGRRPVSAVPSTVTILRKAPPPRPSESRLAEAVRFRYYEVCGSTAAEALHQTRILGPYDSGEGERFSGQTRWSLGWSYDYTYEVHSDTSAGTVRVSAEVFDVNVYSDVEVLLPKLDKTCRLDEREQAIWDRSMESLRTHEMDHVSLVLHDEASRSMADSIAGVRHYEFPRGMNVDSAVRRAVRDDTHSAGVPWVQWIKRVNDDYDEVTRHGLVAERRDDFFRFLE